MRKYIKFLIALVIVYAGCTKDFLDINNDPNNPLTAPINQVLPFAEQTLGYAFGTGGGHADDAARDMQHLSNRADLWALNGNSVADWTYTYSRPLQDLEYIIAKGTADNNTYYAGIAKILKAYAYATLVDLYADCPFTEACKSGNFYPVFDKGEDIYPQLFTLLDEAIADLQVTTVGWNLLAPGAADVIYAGNKAKWIRAANTLKLKMYTQIRLVQDVTADATALITDGAAATTDAATISSGDGLILSGGDFMVPFGALTNPDTRNQGYVNEYTVGQKGQYVSPWLFDIMKGRNPNIFTGIVDPRCPYYWYQQLAAAQATREGNATEFRYLGFVSIYPGSYGPNRDGSTDGSMSVIGIYPVGGRYDDGAAIRLTATSGTGAAPVRFITYADRCFLEAELYNVGEVAGGVVLERAAFSAGLDASFAIVDRVVTLCATSQTVPVVATSAATTTYKTDVLALFDAAAAARRLEIIMTQKWIQGYGYGIDQLTDYRRTGYPIIFDPRLDADGQVPNPCTNIGVEVNYRAFIPVQRTNEIQISYPWPVAELNLNSSAPAQKVPSTYKIFWMP